jgi:hypothetical protein
LISDSTLIYSLVALNIVLYGLLLFGYVRRRTVPIPELKTANEAFAFLENSFKLSFPGIPDGFTWPELISKAKDTALASPVNWQKVQTAVSDYEAYRYGQKSEPLGSDSDEILKLGALLRKRRKVNS